MMYKTKLDYVLELINELNQEDIKCVERHVASKLCSIKRKLAQETELTEEEVSFINRLLRQ